MKQINGYPEGSDLTILNTLYQFPKRNQETGKYDKGSLSLIYRDNVTGEKKMQEFNNPEYTYYMAKPEFTPKKREYFIKAEEAEAVTTPYNDLLRSIAEKTNNMEFYNDNIRNGNRGANKQLHTHTSIFSSDMNIEDKYRMEFDRMYSNNAYPISKTYFDIEVDGKYQAGDFPEPGECPINAISNISGPDHTIYVLLLRTEENINQISEFEAETKTPKLEKELRDFVRKQVGGRKNEIRYGLDTIKYKFLFYDEVNEINLIHDLFTINNFNKPDFILAWNMAFDIPYIIQRIINLGFRPEDIMCHPDFKNKIVRYNIDDKDFKTGKRKESSERGDKAMISSYSVYLDQLIQHASRRKGQGKQSYKLDAVGERMANIHKLDYSHITQHIAELPYLDYKTFVFYNIMDTIVQLVVEKKAADIDYIFNKCLENNTRYDKGHRQVTYLPNAFAKHIWYECGMILGNNPNAGNKKPEEKYPGAYVAEPKRLNNFSKLKQGEIYLDLYDNSIDFDYSAQYPNEVRENNIAPWTEIGAIEIEEKIWAEEDMYHREHFKRGGQFVEDFDVHNWLEFGARWLHLGQYDEVMEDVLEYLQGNSLFYNPILQQQLMNPGQGIDIMYQMNKKVSEGGIEIMKTETNENLLVEDDDYVDPMVMSYLCSQELLDLPKSVNLDEVVYRDDIRNANGI